MTNSDFPTNRFGIPDETIQELKALHAQSRRVRGFTPVGHPDRLAGDELAAQAVAVMDIYGVTVSRLSILMGLDVTTLKFFLGRRGAIQQSPSAARNLVGTPYRNKTIDYAANGRKSPGRKKQDKCGRGHDTSTPETRQKSGKCKACAREDYRARADRKDAA